MMDYRGFGKSTGRRNEATLYDDANHLYNRLVKKFCRKMGISKAVPFKQIPAAYAKVLMHGTTAA